MSMIEVENLSFRYGRLEILRNLSFSVEPGRFLAIAGPNGAGKSTLLGLLCKSLKQNSGTIKVDSAKIKSYSTEQLARKVALVRQEFVPTFGFSVIETVMMARTPYFNQTGFETQADRDIVQDALEATETEQFASRQLGQISGGERQRVFIARAMAQDTPVLLLDEPTSFLDLRHQVQIYDLLKKMQLEKGKTIVAITHDINLAAQYCDEVLLLAGDTDYHTGVPEEVFTTERIESVFGITGFAGQLGTGKFFLPLGEFAKYRQNL